MGHLPWPPSHPSKVSFFVVVCYDVEFQPLLLSSCLLPKAPPSSFYTSFAATSIQNMPFGLSTRREVFIILSSVCFFSKHVQFDHLHRQCHKLEVKPVPVYTSDLATSPTPYMSCIYRFFSSFCLTFFLSHTVNDSIKKQVLYPLLHFYFSPLFTSNGTSSMTVPHVFVPHSTQTAAKTILTATP